MPVSKDRAQSFCITLPNELSRYYEDKKKELGAGGFAKVILAEHVITKEKVAIKVMNKRYLAKKDDLHRAYNEIYALKNVIHQHISQLYEVFETEEYIYLVLEYCPGGELFDYIVSKKRLNEKEARHVFRQIISAVAFIHENGYAHRDLKPENMLLDNSKNIKIIDFGLSARPEHGLKSPLHTRAGSALYASPELISGEPYYGNETDVWSLGVVLYALLCGFLPFDHENTTELYKKIKKGNFIVPSWLSNLFLQGKCGISKRLRRSSGALNLLKDMLQINPKKRISVQNILSHEWVTAGCSEPLMWQSTFQRKKLDGKVVRLLSDYYKWSISETEKKIFELKYNHLTAMYFLLAKMSDNKLRKFRNTWLLNVSKDITFNQNLVVPGQMKLTNGTTRETYRKLDVDSRGRSNTMDSPTILHVGKVKQVDTTTEPAPYSTHRRRSKTMDTIKKELASVTIDTKNTEDNDDSLDKRERSKTSNEPTIIVTATRTERSKTLSGKYSNYVNTDVLPNKYTPLANKEEHPSNLHTTKRFAASCIDHLNTNTVSAGPSQQSIHKTRSLGRPLENGLKEEKRPRTKSVKDFTQRLSGLFKQMNGPRRVKAIYHVENTSVLSADDVRIELDRVLTLLVSKEILASFSNPDRYLFKCKSGPDKKTKFELEICLIPFMDNVVGIRRKRLKGDAWKYKELVEYVLSVARI